MEDEIKTEEGVVEETVPATEGTDMAPAEAAEAVEEEKGDDEVAA